MHCSWVEERLVALHDDELSRSEQAVVLEHLERCPTCSELEARLAGIELEPALVIPAGVQVQLASAIDAALDEAFAQPWESTPPSAWEQTRRWLRRDRDLSNGAMLAYAAVLAVCVGWGLSNYLAVQAMQEEVPIARTSVAPVTDGHYQPASWAVEEEAPESEEEWR